MASGGGTLACPVAPGGGIGARPVADHTRLAAMSTLIRWWAMRAPNSGGPGDLAGMARQMRLPLRHSDSADAAPSPTLRSNGVVDVACARGQSEASAAARPSLSSLRRRVECQAVAAW